MQRAHIIQKFRLETLKAEYEKCSSARPKYSIRHFAKQVGMEASTLSKYFRNKRKVSQKSFQYLIKNLGLNQDEIALKEETFIRENDGVHLLDKKFEKILGNWFYFAILECLHLDRAEPDIRWLAKTLGLDVETVRQAVQNLKELGALKEEDGKWLDNLTNISFITSEDMDIELGRQFQRQLIKLSEVSIEKNTQKSKSHTGVMVAADSALVPQAKEMIRNFRRDLMQFLEQNSKNKDTVLNLQINFFSLDKK